MKFFLHWSVYSLDVSWPVACNRIRILEKNFAKHDRYYLEGEETTDQCDNSPMDN